MASSPPLGVYIHIPYCRRICRYCDFVHEPCPASVPHDFIDSLVHEIMASSSGGAVDSIFLGGGTPSLLTAKDLQFIVGALHKKYDIQSPEFTLEANPDDVTTEKLNYWQEYGINRISLGVQSFSDDTLRFLGRRHTAKTALDAAAKIAETFENWNLDLIYGAPPLSSWKKTLAAALSFDPPHIAAYALGYVPGTELGDCGLKPYADLTVLRQYRRAEEMLSAYNHYEISNFAKKGKESRHNLKYWRNEEHDAYGPGAYSLRGNRRQCNIPFVESYIVDPLYKAEDQILSPLQLKLETMIQHMRLKEGITEAYYYNRFQENIADQFGSILNRLIADGLVHHKNNTYFPTRKGFYFNDTLGLQLVSRFENIIDV
ncbi:MAG TPA: radical SAM family heme chaperone HemW [Candidatus Hydrogenedentes bacterium]|nr:radical SAM family heme chaperone HemW [Candidatus Hydrogenedentota bacterium]HOR50982.1 radical SAM family heme chaperone HemW [Candidatus Hydrogenedentota bacterium]HPK24934.1 radical SAM family heme chaperone HemW [Candidatus Hydrogenedentota bacterium]